MTHEVAAHLAVIVRQAARKSLRFRHEKQARILVRIGRHQYYAGRLKILFAFADVSHAGGAAFVIGVDAGDVREIEDGEVLRLHGFRNGGDRCRILGADVTAAASAIAVVNAAGTTVISL